MKTSLVTSLQILFAISILLAACGPSAASLSGTANAALAQTQTAGFTPAPTLKPTRTTIPTTDRTATAEARATEEMNFITEKVASDLEMAGYSIDQGELALEAKTDIDINISEGGNWRYWEPLQASNPTYDNFVLGVDVTWESETGIAGCNILFRGESDASDGEYIVFRTVRLSGYPGWDLAVVKFNEYQAFLTGKNTTNAAIKLTSGSTNHYVLVAEGTNVTVYANGTRLGEGLSHFT